MNGAKAGTYTPHDMRAGEHTNDRLLLALAEHLKSPLMHIARGAELTRLDGSSPDQNQQMFTTIEAAAETALHLIDNYILSAQFTSDQVLLPLEPLTVSSALHDAAQRLQRTARYQNCELEVQIKGKLGPVMANRQALEGALVSLGYVFIEACQKLDQPQRIIRLAAHNSSQGVVAGVFTQADGLSNGVFRRARELYGQARMPMPALAVSAGAGVFVADSLFGAMDSNLRVARHNHAQGLAATLMPSRQLSLL